MDEQNNNLEEKCNTIRQNESEVAQVTCLVFYVVVLRIFNATFSRTPNENQCLVLEIQAVEGFATFNDSQLAKMKKSIPHMSLP